MKRKTTRTPKTAQSKKLIPVEYAIDKIELIDEAKIDIPGDLENLEPENFGFDFIAEVKLIEEKKCVVVTISYRFLHGERILYDMQVDNEYTLINYNEVVEGNKLLNHNFAIYLVDLSVKHSRGVQAQVTKGTKLSAFPMAYISEKQISEAIKHN